MPLEPLPLKDQIRVYLWYYLWVCPGFYQVEKKICIALKIRLDDYAGPYCNCGHRFYIHDYCVCTQCQCSEFSVSRKS